MIDKYSTNVNEQGQGGNVYVKLSSARTASLAVLCLIRTARLLKPSVPRSRHRSHSLLLRLMTCHSDKAPIYYMTARVAFKKKKVVHERLVWIVSVFDNPNDIRNYDAKTMSRIEQEFYGKTKAVRSVMIREIVDKKLLITFKPNTR